MSHNLKLSRAQLAEFLRDHDQIKQFEELFSQTNSTADTVELLVDQVALLENPPGIAIAVNHQADTDAYWIVATVTGLTVTLPKCTSAILGRTWDVTLAAVGDVTIETFAGDTVATPANPAETTIVLDRRGSTVSMRCISTSAWSFA